MDEISKLVFGCIALVGLVVMIIPNSDPLASKNAKPVESAALPAAPSVPPAASVPEPAAAAGSDNGNGDGFAVQDYDIGSFGQPMVDPTPPGQRSANQPYANQNGVLPAAPQVFQGETPPPQGQYIPPGAPGVPTSAPPMVQAN